MRRNVTQYCRGSFPCSLYFILFWPFFYFGGVLTLFQCLRFLYGPVTKVTIVLQQSLLHFFAIVLKLSKAALKYSKDRTQIKLGLC